MHTNIVERKIYFRQVGQSERILAALRNTLILSILLGLGFVIGFFPSASAQSPQQYLFVLLNTSSGVFIFVSSIVTNTSVTTSIKRTLSVPRSSITTVSDTCSMYDGKNFPFLDRIRHSISHSLGAGSMKTDIKQMCQDKPQAVLSVQESTTKIIMKISIDKEIERRRKQN